MGAVKQIVCPNNHYYNEVGRTSNGSCAACRRKYLKKYFNDNRVELRKKRNTAYHIKLNDDVNFKLSVRLRHRLYEAIKGDYKSGSAVKDLGCSIASLKQYIESKFYGKMTWDNWGEVWELDHIKELREFNLQDPIQFKQAINYINLQPLTISDHIKKTSNRA